MISESKKAKPIDAYRLYLVTDDHQDLATLKHVVNEAINGGVTMVQLREKHGDIRAFIQRAQAIKPLLSAKDIPLIINDRVDVALAIDADGVHLGQSDMPAAIARQLLGPDKIIGLSVENWPQLEQANTLPIDYIGLSAIFTTDTKTDTKKQWGIDGLKRALNTTSLPVVAIGGINQTNIPELWATGVHGLAIVSAICRAPDPKSATIEIRQQMTS